jgi:hypothetical protein
MKVVNYYRDQIRKTRTYGVVKGTARMTVPRGWLNVLSREEELNHLIDCCLDGNLPTTRKYEKQLRSVNYSAFSDSFRVTEGEVHVNVPNEWLETFSPAELECLIQYNIEWHHKVKDGEDIARAIKHCGDLNGPLLGTIPRLDAR